MKTEIHNDLEYLVNEPTKASPLSPKVCQAAWEIAVQTRDRMFTLQDDDTVTFDGTGAQFVALVAWVLRDMLRDAEGKQAITGWSKVRVRKSLEEGAPTEESIEEIKERGATA